MNISKTKTAPKKIKRCDSNIIDSKESDVSDKPANPETAAFLARLKPDGVLNFRPTGKKLRL